MKTSLIPVFSRGVLTLAALAAAHVSAQYAIDWSTIDGGGGTSTGGVYTVTGTIGQPDAGTMSGGNYTLAGGFWGVIAAIPNEGAPDLRITRTETNTVVISWPNPSTGFVLQQKAELSSGAWAGAPETPVIMGDTKQVVINPPIGNRYYRLTKP